MGKRSTPQCVSCHTLAAPPRGTADGTLRPRGTSGARTRRIARPWSRHAAPNARGPGFAEGNVRNPLRKPMWGNRMSDPTPRAGLPLVLLAGDHPDDTNWLRNLLEPAGYAVLREPSGRYALERARGTEPDVVIVDADLPDMPGVELCRLLRADPRVLSSTPLLLAFRDHASREQRIAALRAGAWECIAPPHEADEILLKIGAYVRAKLDADRARAEGLLDPGTGLFNRQGLARRARELGSQAFREHDALSCVVLALDLTPDQASGAKEESATPTIVRCVHALRSSARLSDVIGRLSPTEFAVLAPGTDAAGARRLAERLASTVQASAGAAPTPAPAPDSASQPQPPLRVRCGYEAVANVGYAPIEPVDLLVRASTALRTGRAESGSWLRRFDDGVSASPP